jgi:3,4-dihydroxy-9,10-secoandrosta-1,3,5(10)-triene-9,17-dione 4,5-dioxygenase
MRVHSLGYLRLTSPHIEQWRVFARDFLGMMPLSCDSEASLHFRMDDYPIRLTVSPGPDAGAEAIGYEVANARALASVVADVEKFGLEVRPGTAAGAHERMVTGYVAFDDPGRVPVEVFYGPVLTHLPVVTPSVSRFVTGSQGMGHVIVSTPDVPTALDFYTSVLGFVERNTMKTDDGETLYFLGCNERHHTLGLYPLEGAGRLVHIMVEVATIDDIGRAIDRVEECGLVLQQTLGRHTNDHMVSFYVTSPEGYSIEYGWDGLRVDGEEPTYEITQGAFWGHKYMTQTTD